MVKAAGRVRSFVFFSQMPCDLLIQLRQVSQSCAEFLFHDDVHHASNVAQPRWTERARSVRRSPVRARMHSHGMAVVAGMLTGRHVGVAGPGDRVMASSTLHAGYVCMDVGEDGRG